MLTAYSTRHALGPFQRQTFTLPVYATQVVAVLCVAFIALDATQRLRYF
jgi:hypothetical protein